MSKTQKDVRWDSLSALRCCHPITGRVYSLPAGVEALRVRLDQDIFTVIIFLSPWMESTEVSEVCVLTEVLYTTCVGMLMCSLSLYPPPCMVVPDIM